MTANPVELIGGLTTTTNVVKADLVSWAKARVAQVMASVSELQSTNLAAQLVVIVKNVGTYYLDTTDTTTADNGTSCIISADGYRFKPMAVTVAANALFGDGAVGTPGMAFAGEPSSGLYRVSAGHIGMSVLGAKIVDFGATLVAVAAALSVSGVLSSSNATSGTSTTAAAITGKSLGLTENLFVGGAGNIAGALTLSGALTYGGATLSNAVTGTGNMVLSASPTLTGTVSLASATLSGALSATSTTDATSTTTGAITTAGGISSQKRGLFNSFTVGSVAGNSWGTTTNFAGIGLYYGGTITSQGAGQPWARLWQTDVTLAAAVNGDELTGLRLTMGISRGAFSGTTASAILINPLSGSLDYAFNSQSAGKLLISDTTASTNTITGSGVFGGGIGIAGAANIGGNVGVAGSILSTSSSAGSGYGVGAGSSIGQTSSKSNPVTLNNPSGQITLNNAALAANTTVTFTFTCSSIGAQDTMSFQVIGGNATTNTYQLSAEKFTAGTAQVNVKNVSAGSLSEALVFQYNVHKGSKT